MAGKKIVLAYSGGLDTSVAVRWLQQEHGYEVIAFAVDIGNEPDFPAIREKALKLGAAKAVVYDAREEFVKDYVFPALQANVAYEGQYPLATALGRPLIVKKMVEVARAEGAGTVGHGCTGKGNDQVRFDVGFNTLAPDLQIIAPARQWQWSREETIAYAEKHDIPIPVTTKSPYSIDQNLWGRAIECGVLEDPWVEPPADAFLWTASSQDAPAEPEYLEIGFKQGIPVSLNGKTLAGIPLIEQVNEIAGRHGVGRIDMIEDRVVGIKSREVYEAPAAIVLLQAHRALESLVLSRQQLSFNEMVSARYADLVYDGFWFTPFREDLAAYVSSTQRPVTGMVRLRLHRGASVVVGRKSVYSIYRHELATYDQGDAYDHNAAEGFIHLWGLPARTQMQVRREADKGGKS